MKPEDLAQLAEEAEQELRQQIKGKLVEEFGRDVAWQAKQEISKTISAWLVKELVPALQEWLTQNKEGLIASAIAIAATASDTLTKAMVEEMTKKLSESYTRRQILKAMFD